MGQIPMFLDNSVVYVLEASFPKHRVKIPVYFPLPNIRNFQIAYFTHVICTTRHVLLYTSCVSLLYKNPVKSVGFEALVKVRYNAMYSGGQPTFRPNIPPTFPGSVSKPNKKPS
jgi:hypothetical protein